MSNTTKICPKCNNTHEKPGTFCSRSCANSKPCSEESKRKKSESYKLYCSRTNPDWVEELARRYKLRVYNDCVICGNPCFKRKTCSDECLLTLRTRRTSKSTGYHRRVQSLITDGGLPDSKKQSLPQFGRPGQGGTLEIELNRRKKISNKAKGNTGGYRKGSGRGKKGWYKGIFCDSSWELAFVLYCEINNTPITRNMEKFDYIYNNRTRKYLPDFLVNGNYVEIKGYMDDRNKAKLDQFPHPIIIYDYYMMKPILDTIILRYGKNFIELYE